MTQYVRLSDKIHDALKLAIEQEAVDTAHHLFNALECALTRKTGGPDFVEKRGDIDDHIAKVIDDYRALRRKRLNDSLGK